MNSDLKKLLQRAYSGEKAAALAYQGHSGSLKNSQEILEIQQIEKDEWDHREIVLKMLSELGYPVSKWLEFKLHVIGTVISYSCYIIGWFMPMYFAGRLESSNVNEYIELKRLFHLEKVTKYDACLEEMALKEKDHEEYFKEKVRSHFLTPIFQKVFKWGPGVSFNKLDSEKKLSH